MMMWRGATVVAAAVCFLGTTVTAHRGGPVPLIIDSDMDFDVDDVGAVCIANALADMGETDILAVVHDTGYPEGVGAESVLMHWYGRDDVPIGAFKGKFAADKQGKYVPDLVANWPSPIKNYSQVPDAVTVYRQALAKAYDGTVVISSIGFMTNLAALLASPPDSISPLSGHDLVAAKVRLVAVMGGAYPDSGSRPEFNLDCGQGLMGPALDCQGKSAAAVSGMPPNVRMVFSGFDIGVITMSGAKLTSCAPVNNPCRQAYVDWLGPNKNRCSWDPLTTLYAVRGAAATHVKEVGQGGTNHVDPVSGGNKWVPGKSSNQTYLQLDGSDAPAQIGAILDDLLCRPPKSPPPPPPAPEAGWVKASGFNCYGARGTSPAHGAKDLENPPSASSGIGSVDACQARCDATPGCDGVTVTGEPSGGYQCYRKGDVNLAQCDSGAPFDTWVKGAWVKAAGFNCYGARNGQPAHGAKDLEHPPSASAGVMSLQACQALCDKTSGCDGVTTAPAAGGMVQCYRKGDIVLGGCDKGTSFDTYVSAAASPRR